MKIIFLDIDGVLAHSETVGRSRGEAGMHRFLAQVDEACARRLVELVRRTGARVVLSSTWRLTESGYFAVRAAIKQAGGDGCWLLDDTPTLDRRTYAAARVSRRSAEISAWLAASPEDIEAHVVIDDDPNVEGHPLVLVEHGFHRGGLQDAHVEQAAAILGEAPQ